MKSSELKNILNENRNVKATIGHWEIKQCKDSLAGDSVFVRNIYNVDKSFDSRYDGDMIKLFMNKVSYYKRRCNLTDVVVEVINF